MMLNEVDKCVEDTRREGDRRVLLKGNEAGSPECSPNLSIFVFYQAKANFQKLSEQSKDFHTHLKGIWRRKSEMD